WSGVLLAGDRRIRGSRVRTRPRHRARTHPPRRRPTRSDRTDQTPRGTRSRRRRLGYCADRRRTLMARPEHADEIAAATDAFRAGDPVLIHDAADREGEVDLVYPAEAVTPDALARLRNDAGGLVCVALSDAVARAFALPFAREIIDHPAADNGE